jgi:hypothetical protein
MKGSLMATTLACTMQKKHQKKKTSNFKHCPPPSRKQRAQPGGQYVLQTKEKRKKEKRLDDAIYRDMGRHLPNPLTPMLIAKNPLSKKKKGGKKTVGGGLVGRCARAVVLRTTAGEQKRRSCKKRGSFACRDLQCALLVGPFSGEARGESGGRQNKKEGWAKKKKNLEKHGKVCMSQDSAFAGD